MDISEVKPIGFTKRINVGRKAGMISKRLCSNCSSLDNLVEMYSVQRLKRCQGCERFGSVHYIYEASHISWPMEVFDNHLLNEWMNVRKLCIVYFIMWVNPHRQPSIKFLKSSFRYHLGMVSNQDPTETVASTGVRSGRSRQDTVSWNKTGTTMTWQPHLTRKYLHILFSALEP